MAPVVSDEVALTVYAKEQQLWAIGAVGAYSKELAKRRATAKCLDDLRARGLIN
jgi:hypothetical protein